jgi:uncharacterized CHY-type Zn-finger protein
MNGGIPTRAGLPRDRPRVFGVGVEDDTRCAHYHSALDVIAIKLRCCGEYYACIECHDALAGHAPAQWANEEFGTRAILCGGCGTELTIDEYLGCGNRCAACGAHFNPRCSLHHHFYFATT